MSDKLKQFLERAVEEASRRMTAIQKGEYDPKIEVVRQTRSTPAPAPQAAAS